MSSSSQAQVPSSSPDPSTQNSVLEGKAAAWADGLPRQGGANPCGTLIRRAVSDSHALSKALFEDWIPGLAADGAEENSVRLTGLESTLVYGPNSPRRKSASVSDYASASALSESVSQNIQQSVGEPAIAKTVKRNSRQHSRDRKVRYIAELERTINLLQTLNTELEVRVVSQNQQCAALYMENNILMQRLATLEDQIFIKEGQYQLLKKENERLKNAFASGAPEAERSLVTWQILDMAKRNLS
ncbi:uncharacterized protein LOC110425905 [Herrania umbratica]|uniref:Uncharacterized protein LOC110425905 n=1 Tax=Herrania umbratica TaxID=108875 RepID=A0A6J1BBN6_9ROSI|nr:uncharacterized protein LOC110425905 [Herrania umbratica]